MFCSVNYFHSSFACGHNATFLASSRTHEHGSWKRTSLGSVDTIIRNTSTGVTVDRIEFTSTEVPVVRLSDSRNLVCDVAEVNW